MLTAKVPEFVSDLWNARRQALQNTSRRLERLGSMGVSEIQHQRRARHSRAPVHQCVHAERNCSRKKYSCKSHSALHFNELYWQRVDVAARSGHVLHEGLPAGRHGRVSPNGKNALEPAGSSSRVAAERVQWTRLASTRAQPGEPRRWTASLQRFLRGQDSLAEGRVCRCSVDTGVNVEGNSVRLQQSK